MKQLNIFIALFLLLSLWGCAHNSLEHPLDPLEPINRKVFIFNTELDTRILRPVAVQYKTYTPAVAQKGLRNFFLNLNGPRVIVNDVLQGKIKQGSADTGRFLLNSTVGLLGVIDVASHMGLALNNEDFGQTLGVWGIGEGWFLMLPFRGPSNNRDTVGIFLDSRFSPLTYADWEWRSVLSTLNFVNTRAQLLGVDNVLENAFDPYTFLRTHYLQHRQSVVRDGQVESTSEDEVYDFDDLDDFE